MEEREIPLKINNTEKAVLIVDCHYVRKADPRHPRISFLFCRLFPLVYCLIEHLCFGPFADFSGFVHSLERTQINRFPSEADLGDPNASTILIDAPNAGFTARKGFPFPGFPAYAPDTCSVEEKGIFFHLFYGETSTGLNPAAEKLGLRHDSFVPAGASASPIVRSLLIFLMAQDS